MKSDPTQPSADPHPAGSEQRPREPQPIPQPSPQPLPDQPRPAASITVQAATRSSSTFLICLGASLIGASLPVLAVWRSHRLEVALAERASAARSAQEDALRQDSDRARSIFVAHAEVREREVQELREQSAAERARRAAAEERAEESAALLAEARAAAERLALEASRERTLSELVFVVDTTASMKRHLPLVRELLADAARSVGQKGQEFRAGLVTFRDAGESFVTRRVALREAPATQSALFQELSTLEAEGGGSTGEPLGAALRAALVEGMGWQWSRRARRVVVFVSDAPARDAVVASDAVRWAGLLGVEVHGIHLGSSAAALEQFRGFVQLAGGSVFEAGVFPSGLRSLSHEQQTYWTSASELPVSVTGKVVPVVVPTVLTPEHVASEGVKRPQAEVVLNAPPLRSAPAVLSSPTWKAFLAPKPRGKGEARLAYRVQVSRAAGPAIAAADAFAREYGLAGAERSDAQHPGTIWIEVDPGLAQRSDVFGLGERGATVKGRTWQDVLDALRLLRCSLAPRKGEPGAPLLLSEGPLFYGC